MIIQSCEYINLPPDYISSSEWDKVTPFYLQPNLDKFTDT